MLGCGLWLVTLSVIRVSSTFPSCFQWWDKQWLALIRLLVEELQRPPNGCKFLAKKRSPKQFFCCDWAHKRWGGLSATPASNRNSAFTVERRKKKGTTLPPLLLVYWGREWKQQVSFSPQYYTVTLCLRTVTRSSRTQTQVAVISARSPFMAPDQTALRSASRNTELHARHYPHTERQVPSRFISLSSPA